MFHTCTLFMCWERGTKCTSLSLGS